jgi:hypothetical protein
LSSPPTDPILALWQAGPSSDWTLVSQNDDVYGAYGGWDWDSGLRLDLMAGSYMATVTNYSNFAKGPLLSDGFSGAGGSDNLGAYTLNITGDTVAPVPETEEWVMLMVGLPLVGWMTRRRQEKT